MSTEKRPIPGHARAETLLREAERGLMSAFKTAEASFAHMGDRGGAREAAVRAFLSRQLPSRFVVAQGEVMDAGGAQSGQTDVLIYDAATTRPLSETGGVVLLPAEALLAVVEVKSTLTRAETDKSVTAATKLRGLRPWDAPWEVARRDGRAATDGLPRIFSTLLAFQTDLTDPSWPTSEMTRIRACCEAHGLPTAHLDRVVVLGRGVLVPSAGSVFVAPEEASVVGQWFYQLASFLSREVSRREAFPWDRYRLPYRGSWTTVSEPLDDAPVVARATTIGRLRSRNQRNRRVPRRSE